MLWSFCFSNIWREVFFLPPRGFEVSDSVCLSLSGFTLFIHDYWFLYFLLFTQVLLISIIIIRYFFPHRPSSRIFEFNVCLYLHLCSYLCLLSLYCACFIFSSAFITYHCFLLRFYCDCLDLRLTLFNIINFPTDYIIINHTSNTVDLHCYNLLTRTYFDIINSLWYHHIS